jgi:hypothetical protein
MHSLCSFEWRVGKDEEVRVVAGGTELNENKPQSEWDGRTPSGSSTSITGAQSIRRPSLT